MTTTAKGRARASGPAKRATTSPNPASATQFDVEAMSAALGVPVTAEQAAQAERSLDMVNLDEIVAQVVRVALTEWAPETYTSEVNGQEMTRYKPRPRVAEIALMPDVPTQLEAMNLGRSRRGTPIDEQVPDMLRLILKVWQLSEPDMTIERLQRGLDVWRISKLFQMLFTPPSRQ